MPRKGLNIPIVTVLDETGKIIESDQKRIIKYTIQNGYGADSLFICGTTGEFNRITNSQRQRLLEIGVSEVHRANTLLPKEFEPVEAWVGVTAETKAKTLENLELALHLNADMAVIAPLAIADLDYEDIIKFFEKDVAKIIGEEAALPIGLYENPDIVVDNQKMTLLPLSCINALRALPFVACLKASTTREVMRDYIHAFYAQTETRDFPLYLGNAGLSFELEDLQREAGVAVQKTMVAGVVSGTANLFPREWRQAWNAVVHGDSEGFAVYKNAFAAFEKFTVFRDKQGSQSKLIAGVKQALYSRGVISSPDVAHGTPALTVDEAKLVTSGLDQVLSELSSKVSPQFLSVCETAASEASINR